MLSSLQAISSAPAKVSPPIRHLLVPEWPTSPKDYKHLFAIELANGEPFFLPSYFAPAIRLAALPSHYPEATALPSLCHPSQSTQAM
jgi:hypothetical protein